MSSSLSWNQTQRRCSTTTPQSSGGMAQPQQQRNTRRKKVESNHFLQLPLKAYPQRTTSPIFLVNQALAIRRHTKRVKTAISCRFSLTNRFKLYILKQKPQYLAEFYNKQKWTNGYIRSIAYGKSRKTDFGKAKKTGTLPRGLGRDFRCFAQNNQLRRTRESEPVHQRFEQDSEAPRFCGLIKREGNA